MVTAFGKKLSLSLFVLASMDLKHLPEGNRLKRWKPGCVLSSRMDLALLRQRELYMMDMGDRGQPMIFCAVLVTLCSLFLSVSVQLECQTDTA